jgi:hypothetical protein
MTSPMVQRLRHIFEVVRLRPLNDAQEQVPILRAVALRPETPHLIHQGAANTNQMSNIVERQNQLWIEGWLDGGREARPSSSICLHPNR